MQLKDATVLVVDDEPGLVEVFRAWLQREGCRVLTAGNGQQGLDVASREHIDAIVSDVRMPVMDGIEMARRLNASGGYVAKVVFVSGFSDISERDCYDLGVTVALHKPTRRAQIIASVQRCLLRRETAWAAPPPETPDRIIAARFTSLADARRKGMVAFGHGGFCLRSSFPAHAEEAVGLDLAFDADRHALRGAGRVRWVEPAETQIGVEIKHVDDENRDWAAALSRECGSSAFIPRSSRATDATVD